MRVPMFSLSKLRMLMRMWKLCTCSVDTCADMRYIYLDRQVNNDDDDDDKNSNTSSDDLNDDADHYNDDDEDNNMKKRLRILS